MPKGVNIPGLEHLWVGKGWISPHVYCYGQVAQLQHYTNAEYVFAFVERDVGFFVCVSHPLTPCSEHLKRCLQCFVKETSDSVLPIN